MSNALSSHLDAEGHVHMVDVGSKAESRRIAIALARVRMQPTTLARLRSGDTPKGDVFATVRIAAIMAAKRTADLIPLCHPLPLTSVELAIDVQEDAVELRARTETVGRTGVEMEAMVAASAAALTLYDMLKGIDREITFEMRLLEKHGGKSGSFVRP